MSGVRNGGLEVRDGPKAPSGAGRSVSETFVRKLKQRRPGGVGGAKRPRIVLVPSSARKKPALVEEAGSCGYIDNYLTFLDALDEIVAFMDWLNGKCVPWK